MFHMTRIGLLDVALVLLAAGGSPMEYHLAKTAHEDCDWLLWFAAQLVAAKTRD